MKIKIGPKRKLLRLIKEANDTAKHSAVPESILSDRDSSATSSPSFSVGRPQTPTTSLSTPQTSTPHTATPSTSSISESMSSGKRTNIADSLCFTDKTVRDILMDHAQRQVIIPGLDKGKGDINKMVQILVGELVAHYGNPYPPDEAKDSLAKEIIKNFPLLRDDFDSSLKGHERFYDMKTRQGKIEYRLWQIRKSLPADKKKYACRRKLACDQAKQLVHPVREEDLCTLSKEKHDEEVAAMQLRTPNQENKSLITASLASTIGNRRQMIRKESLTITQIVEMYPRLRDYEGEMIRREFSILHEYKDYIGHFATYYVPKILETAEERIPSILTKIMEITTDDLFIAIAVLPHLLPQPNFSKHQKGAKKAKLSKDKAAGPTEHEDSVAQSAGTKGTHSKSKPTAPLRELVQILEPEANIDAVVQNNRDISQPYLVMLNGDTKPIYLVAEGHLFHLGKASFIEAFDVLFKAHYVFDVHFATVLKFFYNFFEKYVFKMPGAKVLPSVSSLHVNLCNSDL